MPGFFPDASEFLPAAARLCARMSQLAYPRCHQREGEVIDLWYSGKAHRHGGNVQAVAAPLNFVGLDRCRSRAASRDEEASYRCSCGQHKIIASAEGTCEHVVQVHPAEPRAGRQALRAPAVVAGRLSATACMAAMAVPIDPFTCHGRGGGGGGAGSSFVVPGSTVIAKNFSTEPAPVEISYTIPVPVLTCTSPLTFKVGQSVEDLVNVCRSDVLDGDIGVEGDAPHGMALYVGPETVGGPLVLVIGTSPGGKVLGPARDYNLTVTASNDGGRTAIAHVP